MDLKDIEIFLPKYLSPESNKKLWDGLKQFPDHYEKDFYWNNSNIKEILQGDGFSDGYIINLPNTTVKVGNTIIISNSCDIDFNNSRFYETQIILSPIINLEKYINKLNLRFPGQVDRISEHIQNIRNQKISTIFYLPKSHGMSNEGFIFLDKLISLPNNVQIRNSYFMNQLFRLSNLGLYIFLFKLSVHFTRIQEKVDRN